MNITKRGWKKLLALWCALALCLLPCLASASAMGSGEPAKPGDMMLARLAQALQNGRRLDATLRIGLEELNPMLGASAEDVEAVRQLLDTLELRMGFGMTGDNVEIDLAFVLAEKEVMTGKAYVLEEGFALETNLLPGKVLMFPYDKLMAVLEENGISMDGSFAGMDDETMSALMRAMSTYGMLVMEWSEDISAKSVEVTTQSIPATDTRDAATMHAKTRLGDDDFNRLFFTLASRFVVDVELQRALASLTDTPESDIAWVGYELVRQLNDSPLKGHVLDVDVYANDRGEMVGLDYLQMVPMDDDTLGIAANYGRKNQNAAVTDSVRLDIGARRGGGITLDLSSTVNDSVPNALTEDSSIRMRVKNSTPYYAQDALALDGTVHSQYETNLSSETGKVEVTMTMQSAGTEAVSRVTSDISTEALADNDFRTATRMVVEAGMTDMNFFTIRVDWTLASSEYAFVGMEGKTVVDLFTLTDAEIAALGDEVTSQLSQALFAAAANLPTPLLQMFMDMGSLNL